MDFGTIDCVTIVLLLFIAVWRMVFFNFDRGTGSEEEDN